MERAGKREGCVKRTYASFNSLEETLTYVQTKFDIPITLWTLNSAVLKHSRFQKTFADFGG
jgi:hypothetical protein